MANPYFHFKHFTVWQDHCAMKVCTDSCILGAYAGMEAEVKNILDIGAGTGLLSLMIAQKTQGRVDAIEINRQAFEQAVKNFSSSPWKGRLKIYHKSLQDFLPSVHYDLIVCNPPFFENHTLSDDLSINEASHDLTLRSVDILAFAEKYTAGAFYIMYPEKEFINFRILAEKQGLYPAEIIDVRDKRKSQIIRIIGKFSTGKKSAISEQLIIKDENGEYSERFRELLKDYYLNF